MLLIHHHHLHLHLLRFSSPNLPSPPLPIPLKLSFRPTNHHSRKTWIVQASGELTTATDAAPSSLEGPVELPPSTSSIFATDDEPTPLQTATSVLLTGAITVFLFRSLRRRAKRATETKFRSSGEKKSLAEEAMDSLKSVNVSSVGSKSPPTPVQTFLGAITAGVIALILYKFTLIIESSLNRQTISDNYSVRQISLTIRTIINGICYLATFVFGANSIGLLLYSGQLAFNTFMEGSSREGEASSSSSETVDSTDYSDKSNASEDRSSDNPEK